MEGRGCRFVGFCVCKKHLLGSVGDFVDFWRYHFSGGIFWMKKNWACTHLWIQRDGFWQNISYCFAKRIISWPSCILFFFA